MSFLALLISLLLLLQHSLVSSLPTADSGKAVLAPSSDPQLSGKYLCETTEASPRVASIDAAIQDLRDRSTAQMCKQFNMHIGGSHCTRLSRSADADVGICGDHNQSQYVMCYMVAYAAQVVRDNCAWSGLAGGIFWFDSVPKCRVIVYHS